MEHRKRRAFSDGSSSDRDDIDNVLDSFDSEDTLDAFLKRKQKVKTICQDTPVSDLKIVPLEEEKEKSEKKEKSVENVEVASSKPTSSQETGEVERAKLSNDARDAGGEDKPLKPLATLSVEHESVLIVSEKPHEIVGYTAHTETREIGYELSEEGRAAYQTTYDKYLADAVETSPMDAIKLALKFIHDCERAIYKTKRAQSGAHLAVEAILHQLNSQQRAEYDRLDAEERAKFLKRQKKVKVSTDGSIKDIKKVEKEKLTAALKSVKQLEAMGYDKVGATETLKNAGRLNDETLAAIRKVFA
jgi:hypothetical protein